MNVHLCFHGLGTCEREREPGESRYWIAEDLFLRILDNLVDDHDVRLSFDDGNTSDADIALVALEERGMRATFFPIAGRLEDPSSLSRGDLWDLQHKGMVIGSHGWAHVSWRGLTDAEAHRELIEARMTLEEACGATITQAALPLGRYDRRLLGRLRRAGYSNVFTSDRFPSRPGSWLQARYSVTTDDTVESVLHIVRQRPGVSEARNRLASVAKRVR